MKPLSAEEILSQFKPVDDDSRSDWYDKETVIAAMQAYHSQFKEAENQDLIEDAVNAYFHQAAKELERKDLGDIERRNWEGIKKRCKDYFTSVRQQPSSSLVSHSCTTGAIEQKDWSVPVNGSIDVPDELMPLFNKVGMQFKFVQLSGKDEIIAIAHIVQSAQKFFSENRQLLTTDHNPNQCDARNADM